MLIIKSNGANAAWRQALLTLVENGAETDNDFYYRDELVVFELDNPSAETPDPLFPMPKEELQIINRFITSGENEEAVSHEWTKLYYHRMFDEPNSQMRYIIERLAEPITGGESLMSLWDKNVDQWQIVAPCTLVIWARKRNGRLETHVHAHSSDAYKKLLMNLQEFIAVHLYMARKCGVEPGKYYHVIDSCHIHREDTQAAKQLASKLT